MHIEKNILLKRIDKKPILIDTFCSKDKINQPIVIFCHGYKGFKDWGAWDLMAKRIAEAGFSFIKFNFSHNGGTVDNPIDFPDLEAFGHNNYTKELDDLKAVMDWAQDYFKNKASINSNHIHLIGHSRGGGITILKASEDDRVKKLVTLASVSDFGSRFGTENEIQQWKENGVKYVQNGRTKQQMPHYYQFYEDFQANINRLHIASAAKQLEIPILIIHGDKDTSVSINEAYNIHKWCTTSQLEIIEGSDHVFNTQHPWNRDKLSPELEASCKSIINFIA
jgi:pimeloyl-ACP methyl ester carboxylesterase